MIAVDITPRIRKALARYRDARVEFLNRKGERLYTRDGSYYNTAKRQSQVELEQAIEALDKALGVSEPEQDGPLDFLDPMYCHRQSERKA